MKRCSAMRFKNRKGDTLIEVIVATMIFLAFVTAIMVIPNFIRTSGSETTTNIVNVAKILNITRAMSDEWESASRMQAISSVNPNSLSGVAFKKSYQPLGVSQDYTWVNYTTSGMICREIVLPFFLTLIAYSLQ
jgi:competence protein ComGC